MSWTKGVCESCGAPRSVYTYVTSMPDGDCESVAICFICTKKAERESDAADRFIPDVLTCPNCDTDSQFNSYSSPREYCCSNCGYTESR